MQCGPIRYTAAKPAGAPHDLVVEPRSLFSRIDLPAETGIQDVFRHFAIDQARTAAIAAEIRDAYRQGRKVLVLTERTEHLDAILAALDGQVPAPFVLHGRMSKKQRVAMSSELDGLPLVRVQSRLPFSGRVRCNTLIAAISPKAAERGFFFVRQARAHPKPSVPDLGAGTTPVP